MNESDCYGDGTVYRGQRSKDSEVRTLFTPGPWAVVDGPYPGLKDECYPGFKIVDGPSFKLSCFLTASDLDQQDYEQRMADLNLIAAAPDLYEALEILFGITLGMMKQTPISGFEPGSPLGRCEAALKKARGES